MSRTAGGSPRLRRGLKGISSSLRAARYLAWPESSRLLLLGSGKVADALALRRALQVVDTRAGGLAEAGDVVQAIAEGAITPAHVVADLAELCRGTHPAPQD